MNWCDPSTFNLTVTFGLTRSPFCQSDFIAYYISIAQIVAVIAGATGFFIYKLIRHCKRYKMFSLNVESNRFKESFKNAINKSVAVYVSDYPIFRSAFFLFANFSFLFGYTIYALVGKPLYDLRGQPVLADMSLVVIGTITFMQLFLLIMIGAKVEVFEYTKNPIKAVIMGTNERKAFVRSSLKRMLVITSIIVIFPQISQVFIFDKAEVSTWFGIDLLMDFLLLYYTLKRISFLRFEKEVLKEQAKFSRTILKINCASNFIQEHGALSLVHASTSNSNEANFRLLSENIKELSRLKVNILEERLDLIQNDQSVPMPINTGEISLLPKLLILQNLLTFIPVFAMFLSSISFLKTFSNQLFLVSSIVSAFGMIFVGPFIAVPLFSSHMMFDSKSKTSDESIHIQEDGLEEDQTEPFSSGYRLFT